LRTFETVVASRTSPRKAHVAKSFYLQRRRRLRDARYCSPDESCQHIGNDKSREVWRNPFRPTAQGSVTADDFTKSSSTKSVGPIGGYIFCVWRVNAAGVPKKDDRPGGRYHPHIVARALGGGSSCRRASVSGRSAGPVTNTRSCARWFRPKTGAF